VRYFKVSLSFLLLLGFLSCQLIVATPEPEPTFVTSPHLESCHIYPDDHIWNTPVDTLPLHPNSDAFIRSIGPDRELFPGFGPTHTGAYDGIPYTVVDNSQPMVPIEFALYARESDPGPYPIPPDAAIEDAEAKNSDRHVLVVNTDTCMLYELYHAYPQPDGSWKADSGAVFDLKSNDLRPHGWTSADAAGLAILPGLIRYEEVEAGEIKHALRFAVKPTRNEYVWPARHMASEIADKNVPPMGQRFRLKADFDTSKFSPQSKVILEALKKYGMILSDNANEWKLFGAPDDRWEVKQIRELEQLRPSDFEAVDVTSLKASPNSARIRDTSQADPLLDTTHDREAQLN
jgi:hypothetical protein